MFDQNHDWIGVLLSKVQKESHLFTFYAVGPRLTESRIDRMGLQSTFTESI